MHVHGLGLFTIAPCNLSWGRWLSCVGPWRAAVPRPPMVPAWVGSIARLWPDGRPRRDVADAQVTFIAGPPHQLLRIFSQQPTIEPARSAKDQPVRHQPTRQSR